MKLRNCPFCKRAVKLEYPYLMQLQNGRYVLSHFCSDNPNELTICVSAHGEDPKQVAERWNGNGKKHIAE